MIISRKIHFQYFLFFSIFSIFSLIGCKGNDPNSETQDKKIYVTPNGAGDGTSEASPTTIYSAISKAKPGSRILVKAGTYNLLSQISLPATKSGVSGNMISIEAQTSEKPVFNFNGLMKEGIKIDGNYWYIKGIEICYAAQGISIGEGCNNIIENCVSHHNAGTGIALGLAHGAVNNGSRCANNQIINCDVYLNFDYQTGDYATPGTNADGFGCKLKAGIGNKFIGCRSWRNSDDGWDLFESGYAVTIINCWTWANGLMADFKDVYLEKAKTPLTYSLFSGDGNGFKIGGNHVGVSATCSNQSTGTHVLRNCISFDNIVSGENGHAGFSQNAHKDGAVIENCLSFSNNENFRFWVEPNPGKTFILRNNISFYPKGRGDKFVVATEASNNSWNLSLQGDSTQFVSLREADAIAPRQADGSLPTNFGRLKSTSIFIDKGIATQPLQYDGISLPAIDFKGTLPDLGAFEY